MNKDREARLDVLGSMEQARPPRQGNAVRPQLGELGGDQGGQKLVCDGAGWRLQPDPMGDGAGWEGTKSGRGSKRQAGCGKSETATLRRVWKTGRTVIA